MVELVVFTKGVENQFFVFVYRLRCPIFILLLKLLNGVYHQVLMVAMLDIGDMHILVYLYVLVYLHVLAHFLGQIVLMIFVIIGIVVLKKKEFKVFIALEDVAVVLVAWNVCHFMDHLEHTWVFVFKI